MGVGGGAWTTKEHERSGEARKGSGSRLWSWLCNCCVLKLLSWHILKGNIGSCANYRSLNQPDFLRYVIWRKIDFKNEFFKKAHRSRSFRGMMRSWCEWGSEHSSTGLQRSGGRRRCPTWRAMLVGVLE